MTKEQEAKALQDEAQEHIKRSIDWTMAGDRKATSEDLTTATQYWLAAGAALSALNKP